MKIPFFKYQGTGNDFIIIDNRELLFDNSNLELVRKLCHRRFGIGADGLMLLQNKEGFDFEMVYYNADGSSSMCGNGGRCITQFAKKLNIIKDKAYFLAIDGPHQAKIIGSQVSLKMNDVQKIEDNVDHCFVNTGSPHYVSFVNDIENFDVYDAGKTIRYSPEFKKEGVNVNFIEQKENELFVRTYERGVEDETYSCGTGVTAAALVAASKNLMTNKNECQIITRGGKVSVKFNKNQDGSFSDIWLTGPAVLVFNGEINANGK